MPQIPILSNTLWPVTRKYRVGIDVGTHSAGFFAVEVDDNNFPIKILNSVVYIHDSGVDPSAQKQAETRLAVSGVARRTRRMHRRRKQRLARLDKWIQDQGWPLVDLESEANPYYPWLVRAELASSPVLDDAELHRKLSVALRHMSRHRGWRNPYAKVRSLYAEAPPSTQLMDFRERVEKATGRPASSDDTPAQLVVRLGLNNKVKLRGPDGDLGGKLMQSDNANELRRITEVQGLDDGLFKKMVDKVFDSKSPRGSAAGRIGKDALPGQTHLNRAAKSDEEFQRFRIASVVANLRVTSEGSSRRLSAQEQRDVIDFLMYQVPAKDLPSWADVAKVLDISRDDLKGTAAVGPEGERPSAFPPVNTTDLRVRALGIPTVVNWWEKASPEERAVFVTEVSNAGDEVENEDALQAVNDLITGLSDTELEKLSNLPLPAGRAAYSRDSLQRLSERMLADGLDLTEARMEEFGVAGDWQPPADPIGTPVGNPAVDRVTKQTARWLRAVTNRWGTPLSINIEHVRTGLGSESMAREIDRENNKRFERNRKIYEQMHEQLGIKSKARRSDLTRYLALQRQNGQCAYCGGTIDFHNAEMDHIVPRAGEGGARNTRNNLVAVCERCNKSKSNAPFAVWAEKSEIPGVSVQEAVSRVRHWIRDPYVTVRDHRRFTNTVVERLYKTSSDEPLDERAMESVAWMANELRSRINYHFASRGEPVDVMVYRGAITAEARKASGLEGRVNLIGGRGKTRLDRRHHAVDAAVVALMRPSVAKTLAQRSNLRISQRMTREHETWKNYEGDSHASRTIYKRWLEQMEVLSELLNIALANDKIAVTQNLRLRLANSRVHEDKIRKFDRRPLSSALTAAEVDRASTPALWTALTRLPDYDSSSGLPADESRTIVVNGEHFGPLDTIDLFGSNAASVAVRGGYAELGAAVHHARVYRIDGKRPTYAMIRVYTVDLMKHTDSDLFSVSLEPQTISMRTAPPKLRKAIAEQTADYVGWLVLGDEIHLDPTHFTSGQVGEFLKEFPMITTWRLDGFFSSTRLRLRPSLLSSEGLDEESSEPVRKIVDNPAWQPSVDVVLGKPSTTIVRRTTLGTPRRHSSAGLPTSWRPEAE